VSRWSGAKIARGRERWQTIVREAAKQSIRAWTPVVGDLAGLAELVVLPSQATVLVLDPDAPESLTAPDRIEDLRAARELVLVVGPEGGIAPGELSRLEEAGARAVRLGVEVLRTSTAGPAALAAANVLLGRW
jgi:16S rRNA (uracil1498-N3)-methyltransferase